MKKEKTYYILYSAGHLFPLSQMGLEITAKTKSEAIQIGAERWRQSFSNSPDTLNNIINNNGLGHLPFPYFYVFKDEKDVRNYCKGR